MNSLRFIGCVFIALHVCVASAAPPARYKARLLHPLSGFSDSDTANVSGAYQVGGAYGPETGNLYHAMQWNGTPESAIDLNPAGYIDSYASGIDGNVQVGGGRDSGGVGRALLWHGSASNYVDLHSVFYLYTGANGIDGNTQVGAGARRDTFDTHALMWHGTSASIVDLHPAGFRESTATEVEGNTQVGYGIVNNIDQHTHALLWHGTAASAIDMHPATGFTHSQIWDIGGNSQVGYGQINLNGGPTCALLWHQTPESVVNLHPAGFDYSYANGVVGDMQVGNGILSGGGFIHHALWWNGTSESAVDLHPYLADLPVALTQSYAHAIDFNGTIVGTARDADNTNYAVMWIPVPEPGTAALFACSLANFAIGHLRRRSQPSPASAIQIDSKASRSGPES